MDDELPRNPDISYRPESDTYHLHHDWLGGRELSTTILLALQAITGTDADEQEPMSRYINPEALSELFTPDSTLEHGPRGAFRFGYAGHQITVRATGDVVIALDTDGGGALGLTGGPKPDASGGPTMGTNRGWGTEGADE